VSAAAVATGVRAPAASAPLPAAPAARLLGFATLGAFGALHWARMVDPPAGARMTAVLAICLLAAEGLRRCARTPRRVGAPARAVLLGVLVVAAAAAAGLPLRLLAPGGWGELAAGLVEGGELLPDLVVPYAGDAPWPRLVLLASGALLLVIAVAYAFGSRRGAGRVPAAAVLLVLYAVPAVNLTDTHQFLRGAALTALLGAFLWLEGIDRTQARAAVAALALSIYAGALIAPRLDSARPWVDYDEIAQSLTSPSGIAFDFEHHYGPLNWPRDGRELFRVRAQRRAYWKAVNLGTFDGTRWRRDPRRYGGALSDELPWDFRREAAFNQRVRVTVRALRSLDLVAAGTTLLVTRPPSAPIPAAAPGAFAVERSLQRGDSYAASVYVPDPTADELADAGSDYPQLARRYLELAIPNRRAGADEGGDRTATIAFPAWGSGALPAVVPPSPAASGDQVLSASRYAAAWRLARRLSEGSRSPYEYVQRVQAHLARGFTYSEGPPRHRVPLAAFLVDDRAGYCQHFSGAMALLLRMGGVPARVAAGFSPGSYSVRRGEWVVRDIDAHSWVEAYFPGYGWVTFDPTPGDSPARSQVSFELPEGGPGERPSPGTPGERPEPGPRARDADGASDGGAWWVWPALAAVAAGLAAAWAAVRRARRPTSGDPVLAELERALRRAGHPARPPTTLRALELRFAGEPTAAGYVAALRARRFGHGARMPTASERGGLRRALARESGLAGWVRALWAVPPRVGGPTWRRRRAPG
jgi:transglutaminase-like putative cysteine protease